MGEWDEQLRFLISQRTASRPSPAAPRVIDCPDRKSFITEFAELSRPVIIRGMLAGCEARFWTLETLSQFHGDAIVKVRCGNYVETAFMPERQIREEPLSGYIAQMQSTVATDALPPYAGNNALTGSLTTMIRPPPFFPVSDYESPGLWLGPAGTVTPLHQDLVDNFLIQVFGRKQIILFAPHMEPFLYTWEASNKLRGSKVDPEAPDLASYPDFRRATSVMCTIGVGETLFLPAGWFHHVRSLDISLSINFFSKRLPSAVMASMRRPRPANAMPSRK